LPPLPHGAAAAGDEAIVKLCETDAVRCLPFDGGDSRIAFEDDVSHPILFVVGDTPLPCRVVDLLAKPRLRRLDQQFVSPRLFDSLRRCAVADAPRGGYQVCLWLVKPFESFRRIRSCRSCLPRTCLPPSEALPEAPGIWRWLRRVAPPRPCQRLRSHPRASGFSQRRGFASCRMGTGRRTYGANISPSTRSDRSIA